MANRGGLEDSYLMSVIASRIPNLKTLTVDNVCSKSIFPPPAEFSLKINPKKKLK